MKKKFSPTYQRIYAVVLEIPRGKVMTYGAVARLAGLPHGARQVGWAMSDAPPDVPWQRVVGLNRPKFGKITISDPMTASMQRQILMNEGIEFNDKDEIDLTKYSN
ncbi:MAG: cysteine methyltransferase [Proteobacteria bacterium]|nr:cysteine methyltransferase [Pseudomonadota bacterium]